MTTHHFPNSLVNRVAEAVRRRGTARLSDVAPDFPDQTKKQVHAALCNARDRKLLKNIARGNARAGRESTWAPADDMPEPAQGPKRVPSVWDLADPPRLNLSVQGKRYLLLGPWTDQEQV